MEHYSANIKNEILPFATMWMELEVIILSETSQEIIDAGEDVEKREPSCTVGGNANWCSQSGN